MLKFSLAMLQVILPKKDTLYKLKILTQGAKFDSLGIVGCQNYAGKLNLLKVLFTNYCKNKCRYCYHRATNDIPRTGFSPKEFVTLVESLYNKGKIKGVFLSSGLGSNPNEVLEKMLYSIELLRKQEFKGYIHLKVLPGASAELIKKAVKLADRVSCNLEFATSKALKFWAPDKRKEDLVKILQKIKYFKLEANPKVSTSTQVIIGTGIETDRSVLLLVESLYKNGLADRVYFSSYVPVNDESDLPKETVPPIKEYRFYQAEFLIRKYGFSAREILEEEEHLKPETDPKTSWAERHPEFFPVDLARDDFFRLIRVPGIGLKTAKRILKLRKNSELSEATLLKLGINLAKVSKYALIKGKKLGYLF